MNDSTDLSYLTALSPIADSLEGATRRVSYPGLHRLHADIDAQTANLIATDCKAHHILENTTPVDTPESTLPKQKTKLSLPTFHGDVMKWEEFWGFNQEKLMYLK